MVIGVGNRVARDDTLQIMSLQCSLKLLTSLRLSLGPIRPLQTGGRGLLEPTISFPQQTKKLNV